MKSRSLVYSGIEEEEYRAVAEPKLSRAEKRRIYRELNQSVDQRAERFVESIKNPFVQQIARVMYIDHEHPTSSDFFAAPTNEDRILVKQTARYVRQQYRAFKKARR